ncbi:unnamed protein product [Auanema sp. JU1783]|nr:unnamed protein product [Auanema sp. JU1783]
MGFVLSLALSIEYFSTVLALICLPINIIFVLFVYKERRRAPFDSPFFRLCIHLSMADILMEIFCTLFLKFPMFGLFPTSFYKENWSMLPLMGVNYFGHAQAIGIIAIAFNRFTAVFFPIQHKQKWWRPNVVRLVLILQWTIPILFILPLFFADFNFIFNLQYGSVIFSAKNRDFHTIYFIGIGILDGIFINIVVSFLYAAIFFRVQSHPVVQKPGELAMRLALSAFIIFTSYLCLGIFAFLSAIAPPPDAWTFRTLWFVVNDVLCASNAPVLLALNRPVRQIFLEKIGMRQKTTVHTNSLLSYNNNA